MIEILKTGVKKIATIISPRLNTELLYWFSKGKRINLKNPKTFDEKISWLKLFDYPNNELVIQCADKLLVREYLKDMKYKTLLVKLINVYDNVDEIKWDELPNSFAMKWNMGCGSNILCRNKAEMDEKSAIGMMKKWSKDKFYLKNSEMHYGKIIPKIIVEELLITDDGLSPEDYKFYCFNGKAKYVMVCVGRHMGNTKYYFFNTKWEIVPFNSDSRNFDGKIDIKKPDRIEEMFKIASDLSKPFKFVRVDLYDYRKRIVFGELTFTPAGGIHSSYFVAADELLGRLISL